MNSIPWTQTLLPIAVFFAVAFLIHRLGKAFAPRLARLTALRKQGRKSRPERIETLQGLIAGVIAVLAYLAATLASLQLFVDSATLVWLVGLFGAGFGLSARPVISDFLAGISFLFEDTFSVGEKVELMDVEGVIEHVYLRTTHMRGTNGELYVIPNGDIRVVRNFSRGRFSVATVRLKIPTEQLSAALTLLEDLGAEAVSLLPSLLEPWQVISESGSIGQNTELALIAHARFGMAADIRPRMLALIQERLDDAGIALVD